MNDNKEKIDTQQLTATIEMAITRQELLFKKNNDNRPFEAKLANFIAAGIIAAIKYIH